MSETWLASDTHFSHGNLMKHYPDRAALGDAEGMIEGMIERWNSRINPKDSVFHLGDFGGRDTELDIKIARRLNGRITYLPGNHDKKLMKDRRFIARMSRILLPLDTISIHGQEIEVCHFPIWEWNKIHFGVWHLHGHVHAKPTNIPGKIMDLGVDGNNLTPYHWDEVVAHMATREVRTHHGETGTKVDNT